MNLSEVHSLSPAFPDVDERFLRSSTSGVNTCMASGHTLQYTEDKFKPRWS
ncbi:hypothetical protein [Muribaculum caecicola]|uniref:hypothetical protein n=1 Tax=Muribaculum caecicola TaxID=3038144 RepID=UPI001454F50F|nr:hypothetical protein [Muribaculum caecicola]